MTKTQFDGALGLIQPYEQWDYNPIGFSMNHEISASPLSFSKPMAINDQYAATPTAAEFSMFMGHVVKQLADVSPETTTDGFSMVGTCAPPANYDDHNRPRKFARRSSYGSGSLGDSNNGVDEFHGNGTTSPAQDNNNNFAESGGSRGLISSNDEQGLGLITLLLECAVAISVDNLGEANRMLLEVNQVASPYGQSCAERVVAYFAKAMASRVMNSWLGISTPIVSHKAILSAFQVYNNISPFTKFAHFTANQAILEAFHQRDRVHIIDMDIMQGLQWPPLLHILATRMEGPPHVRMTGMGSSMEMLEETGRQLSNFAKRLGISFQFHPIAKKFGDVDPSMIQTGRGETVAVHCLHHSLYDSTGSDWKAMRVLEVLAPRVMTMVEQDLTYAGSFLDRFVASLHYYSTIFDSLGASFACDDLSRYKVEHCLLAREINNIIAIGGPGRSGEEKFTSWRVELGGRSFSQVPMSSNSMAQAQLILNMFPPSHGYTLHQGDGTLRLGWKDTTLYTVSSWTSHSSR